MNFFPSVPVQLLLTSKAYKFSWIIYNKSAKEEKKIKESDFG